MSQSNIRLKRSSVSGKRPSISNLELGEIALNFYDGNLYAIQDTGGVGIATTVTNLTPWIENYGGSGIEYTGNVNVVGVSTFDDVSIGGTLSLSGAGSQFFAFNEDTVKVKFANWYSSNTRQYGMGQLWYETWFAAVDDQGANENRRIGFYLDLPDKGASDAAGGTGAHPTNDAMHIDLNGVGIAGTVDISSDLNVAGIVTISTLGSVGETLIVGTGNTLTSTQLLSIDTDNDRLGIGITNPARTLHLLGDVTNEGSVRIDQYANGVDGPDMLFHKARGTVSTPLQVLTGDEVVKIFGYAHDGSSFQTRSAILSTASTTGSGVGADWEFKTGNNATPTTRLKIDQDGVISMPGLDEGGIVSVGTGNTLITNSALNLDAVNNRLGIGTANPAVKFHIVGEGANEAQIRMAQYNDTQDAPDVRIRRARGTEAVPADVQTGDYVFRLNLEAMDSGAFTTYGSMQFDVDGTDQDALTVALQTRDTVGTLANRFTIDSAGDCATTGDLSVTGALSKGSGTFTIDHPVREGHKLVHSFVEGPLCDLIYRGKAKLQDGVAVININEHFGMHPGTFESLVDSTDVFITNNNSWDQVRGKMKGAELHIECKNKNSKTTVSWLVIGDRKDSHIKDAKWTDNKGKPILEPKIRGTI